MNLTAARDQLLELLLAGAEGAFAVAGHAVLRLVDEESGCLVDVDIDSLADRAWAFRTDTAEPAAASRTIYRRRPVVVGSVRRPDPALRGKDSEVVMPVNG